MGEVHTPDFATVRYTNWRGETADRRLILGDVRFGSTEWHTEPTWLITAFDLDHPAQIWKDFDLTKCDFTRATPAREAAEDLVEALEMLVHLVSILPPSMDVPDSPLAKARAAIAKAKGGAA